MEKEERSISRIMKPAVLSLQWGSRKRLRCLRIRGRNSGAGERRSEIRRTYSREKEERYYSTRGSIVLGLEEKGKIRVDGVSGKQGGDNEKKNNNKSSKKLVWPKLCIALSTKEKEEDFMAMKGCKLPQRPKKRAKIIQRTLLFYVEMEQLGSPGAWLTDMCWERYEVREKKTSSKKKARGGLKRMGSIYESDSD